ncbi:MAG: tRNA pseudouridine(55) synthase TruB [Pseudomonadota bacterium]
MNRVRRDISGVLLLDKPTGVTSNQALQKLKFLFQARKAGHTGSLDPLATGLLPICFGEATKVSAYLLDADKTYRVSCQFGIKTDTADADGTEVERSNVLPREDDIRKSLGDFVGEIEQLPPMYSAVKHNGQRLYALARKGIEVERKPRRVRIFDLTLVSHEGSVATMDVTCSKGTYVRTLVEDLAAAMGTVAHVTSLRRVALARYDSADLVSLEQLEALYEQGGLPALDARLKTVDSALDHWPSVELTDDSALHLKQGQAVRVKNRPRAGQVRLYGPELRFIGIGEVLADGRVAPRRLMVR